MLSTEFLEAWINLEGVKVLGRELQPLSLRHLMWLHALNSPFARALDGRFEESETIPFSQLRIFVAVCNSKTDREVFKNLKSKRLKKAGRFPFIRNRAWRIVEAYIKDHITAPDILESKGSGTELGGPWLVRLAVSLCKSGLGSVAEMWNLPIGKALWYSAVAAEVEGAIKIGDAVYSRFLKEWREENKDALSGN